MPFDPGAPVHRRTAANRPADVPHAVNGRLTWHGAVEDFRHSHSWEPSTRENIRANLINSRLLHFLTHERGRGLYLDEITAEDCDAYLTWYRQDRGGAFNTVKRIRQHLRQMAVWAREQRGYDGLDRPPLTTSKIPALRENSPASKDDDDEEPALTHEELAQLLEVASAAERALPVALRPDGTPRRPPRRAPLGRPRIRQKDETWMAARDRLIVEMLAFCGLRPGELVNLTTTRVFLDARPPRIEVRGRLHHRSRRARGTLKTEAAARNVPLNMSRTATLAADLRSWLVSERPRNVADDALFCSTRCDALGRHVPLSVDGLEGMLERLGRAAGVHCNAYRFRHTCATWLVEGGMHEQYLMHVMGWDDSSMVTRYFRGRDNPAIMEAAQGIMV